MSKFLEWWDATMREQIGRPTWSAQAAWDAATTQLAALEKERDALKVKKVGPEREREP